MFEPQWHRETEARPVLPDGTPKGRALRWLSEFSPLLYDPAGLAPGESRSRLARVPDLRARGHAAVAALEAATRGGVEPDELALLTTLREALTELDHLEQDWLQHAAGPRPGVAGMPVVEQVRHRLTEVAARRELGVWGTAAECPSETAWTPVAAPAPGRAVIEETAAGLRISVSPKRDWFGILFLGFWLCGWLFGEAFATWALFHSGTPWFVRLFLLAWLGGWTVAGITAGSAFLWSLLGRETASVEGKRLVLRRSIGRFGREKAFDSRQVRNLRYVPLPDGRSAGGSGSQMPGPGHGPIAFTYGGETIRFGCDLDETETAPVLAALRERMG